jgi:DNA-binding NtrC family response regulator
LLATANAKLKGQSTRPAAIPMELAGIRRVRSMATRVATSSINVLVMGETGVGKDVLVHAIHRASRRSNMPLVAVNCAALPENLIESELFGHDRGAFTGATAAKIGLLEAANGGTVFLDEVGELTQSVQAKLLRAIESREVTPIGGVRPHPIDVRFVSATNRDIEGEVAAGRFRGDLMFRLNGISLLVPPLRERTDEIPDLIEAFIAEVCNEIDRKDRPRFNPAAMSYIMSYAWPGNIRELKNVVERAVVLCDGVTLGPEHLPIEKMHTVLPSGERPTPIATPATQAEGGAVLDAKHVADKRQIEDTLAACNGNQTRAALRLGISRRTLITKMEKYNLPRPQKLPRETPPDDD